jgi:hypothetical protein
MQRSGSRAELGGLTFTWTLGDLSFYLLVVRCMSVVW